MVTGPVAMVMFVRAPLIYAFLARVTEHAGKYYNVQAWLRRLARKR